MTGIMRCIKCGEPMAVSDAECKLCGWQKLHNPQPFNAREHRHAEALRTAQYEAQRFRLGPISPGETEDDFIQRINREKTPRVVEHNLAVAKGLDYWNRKQGRTIKLAGNLRKLMDRWIPKQREPGEDDET